MNVLMENLPCLTSQNQVAFQEFLNEDKSEDKSEEQGINILNIESKIFNVKLPF